MWRWVQAVLPVSPGTQVYGQGCAESDGALAAMIERVLTAQGFAPHPVGRRLLAPEQADEEGDEGGEGMISVTAGLGVSGHRAEDGRLYLLGLGTPFSFHNRTFAQAFVGFAGEMYPADLLPKPGSAAEGSAAATAESLRGFGACYLRPELVAAYANAAGEALSANSYLELAEPNEVRRGNDRGLSWSQ